VESCSALIEREDGIVEMVNYHPFSATLTAAFDRPIDQSQVGVSGR
jgi:hypothetical protein